MSSLSLSGENSWNDHFHGLEQDTRENHFRLDLPLDYEPKLDDVDKMSQLEDLTRSNLGELDSIARAIKAASFFFELDLPIADRGQSYMCSGTILSRSPNSQALVENILAEFPHARFVDQYNTPLGSLTTADICEACGRYQICVDFKVHHPNQLVSIELEFSKLHQRKISSFPRLME